MPQEAKRETRSSTLLGRSLDGDLPPFALRGQMPKEGSALVAQRLQANGDLEQQLSPLRGLSRELVARGMPAALVGELLAEIVAEFGNQVLASEHDARLALVEQLLLRITGEPLVADSMLAGPYVISGPAGSGKTVLIAHLALAALQQGQEDVVLVNTEAERIGAAAQMNALGEVFGCTVEHAYTSQELRALHGRCRPGALLLIEAAGWSPCGDTARERNAWTWQVPMARHVVCVPATAQGEDLTELLTAARTVRNPIVGALCKTSDTRNALPALSALAMLRQPVGMVVPGPNLTDPAPAPDLAMIARTALGVVTTQRRKGRVWR